MSLLSPLAHPHFTHLGCEASKEASVRHPKLETVALLSVLASHLAVLYEGAASIRFLGLVVRQATEVLYWLAELRAELKQAQPTAGRSLLCAGLALFHLGLLVNSFFNPCLSMLALWGYLLLQSATSRHEQQPVLQRSGVWVSIGWIAALVTNNPWVGATAAVLSLSAPKSSKEGGGALLKLLLTTGVSSNQGLRTLLAFAEPCAAYGAGCAAMRRISATQSSGCFAGVYGFFLFQTLLSSLKALWDRLTSDESSTSIGLLLLKLSACASILYGSLSGLWSFTFIGFGLALAWALGKLFSLLLAALPHARNADDPSRALNLGTG